MRDVLALICLPLIADGQPLGATMEWRELTDEVEAANEVADVVSAAAEGDFSRRIPLAGKSDGLARIHNLVVNADMTLTATYTRR